MQSRGDKMDTSLVNVPLLDENKKYTQRVKMKESEQMVTMKAPVPVTGLNQIPLNLKKVNTGPEVEDDVAIPAAIPGELSCLEKAVFHKGKSTPQPTVPVQRQESDTAIIPKPKIIGIHNVLKSKEEKIVLKRPHNTYGPISENFNRVEVNKTKHLMAMTDAFKRGEDITNAVSLDQEITPKDLFNSMREPMTMICEGSFGKAYKTNVKGRDIVCKQVMTEVDHKETLTPYKLKHEGIVQMVGVVCYARNIFIFMEDAGTSLNRWIRHPQHLKYLRANLRSFSLRLYKIIQWLEKHKTSHRDIKPENICICLRNGIPVPILIDFGSAQTMQDKPCMQGHTLEYLPPFINYLIYLFKTKTDQVVEVGNHFLNQKSDNYAISVVIIWIWLGGRHPIEAVNQYRFDLGIEHLMSQRRKVNEQIMGSQERHFQPHLPTIPEPLRTVLDKSLRDDNRFRWDANQVCQYLEENENQPSQKRQKKDEDDEDMLADAIFGNLFPNMQEGKKCEYKIVLKQKPTPAATHNIAANRTQGPSTSAMFKNTVHGCLPNNAQSCSFVFGGIPQQPGNKIVSKSPVVLSPKNQAPACGQDLSVLGIRTQHTTRNNIVGTARDEGTVSVLKGFAQQSAGGLTYRPKQHAKDTIAPSKVIEDACPLGNMNIKPRSHAIENPNPGSAPSSVATSSTAGNIPNIDMLEGGGSSRGLTKPGKFVFTSRQEEDCPTSAQEVSLFPRLDIMLDTDEARGGRQKPARRIAHGRRRTSNNKTMP